MPKISKRRAHSLRALSQRYSDHGVAEQQRYVDYSVTNMDSWNDVESVVEEETDLNIRMQLSDIGDLFQLCKSEFSSRNLSVLIYMTLKYFNVSWGDCDEFMKQIGCTIIKTAHKWSQIFVGGDYEGFERDNRGGKRFDAFFDLYPEIETGARIYAVNMCKQRSASFSVHDLAKGRVPKRHVFGSKTTT